MPAELAGQRDGAGRHRRCAAWSRRGTPQPRVAADEVGEAGREPAERHPATGSPVWAATTSAGQAGEARDLVEVVPSYRHAIDLVDRSGSGRRPSWHRTDGRGASTARTSGGVAAPATAVRRAARSEPSRVSMQHGPGRRHQVDDAHGRPPAPRSRRGCPWSASTSGEVVAPRRAARRRGSTWHATSAPRSRHGRERAERDAGRVEPRAHRACAISTAPGVSPWMHTDRAARRRRARRRRPRCPPWPSGARAPRPRPGSCRQGARAATRAPAGRRGCRRGRRTPRRPSRSPSASRPSQNTEPGRPSTGSDRS